MAYCLLYWDAMCSELDQFTSFHGIKFSKSQTDGWMDGRKTERKMDEWTDRQTDRQTEMDG